MVRRLLRAVVRVRRPEDQRANVQTNFSSRSAVAYFVYGITVAPNDSWIARVVLRNRVMTFLGGLTYAAYVMQFVVWIYVNVVTYDSFKQFYPCDKETIHAEHEAAGGGGKPRGELHGAGDVVRLLQAEPGRAFGWTCS